MGRERAGSRPGRRTLLGWTLAAFWLGGGVGHAQQSAQGGDARQPVIELYDGLRAAMRLGSGTPFKQRFDQLAPVIDRTFDLDAILRTSVGLRWSSMDEASRETLANVFRSFTIASYTANFDGGAEQLTVLPQTRAAEGETIVQSKLTPADGDPVRIDYVVRPGPSGWRIVDVLLDGTISRVAVQRSDFRALLASGSPTPLIDSLKRKVADLSGGTMRL